MSINNMNSAGASSAWVDFVNVDQGYKGAIKFATRSAVGEYGWRMFIDETGKVGIGATPTAGDKFVVVVPETGSTDSSFLIGNDQSSKFGRIAYSDGSEFLGIQSGSWGVTPRPLILQGGGGNTGIGSTSANHKLEVAGDLLVSGTVSGYTGTGVYIYDDGNGGGISALTTGGSARNLTLSGYNIKFQSSGTYADKMTLDSSGNVGIGGNPGEKLEIVGGNVKIGNGYWLKWEGASDKGVDLGYGTTIQRKSTDGRLQLNSQNGIIELNGSVGIGKIPSSEKLEVNGNVVANAFFYSSDIRLKTNIRPIPDPEKILQLEGVLFKFKNDTRQNVGLIAQDVEKVLPEIVSTDGNGMKSVDYGKLSVFLIEVLKQQQEEIKDLQDEIGSLR